MFSLFKKKSRIELNPAEEQQYEQLTEILNKSKSYVSKVNFNLLEATKLQLIYDGYKIEANYGDSKNRYYFYR